MPVLNAVGQLLSEFHLPLPCHLSGHAGAWSKGERGGGVLRGARSTACESPIDATYLESRVEIVFDRQQLLHGVDVRQALFGDHRPSLLRRTIVAIAWAWAMK